MTDTDEYVPPSRQRQGSWPPDTTGLVANAMQMAWDDFVGDTGCHPDCITQEGRKMLSADFRSGNFASSAAAWLERDHRLVPKTILDVIPPRLWRLLEAIATVEVPEGWTVEYQHAPMGMVVRRSVDGFVGFSMPSTDGTPRWYNDATIDGRFGGNAAGMSDDAQGAVGYTVSRAPDLAKRDGIEAPDE